MLPSCARLLHPRVVEAVDLEPVDLDGDGLKVDRFDDARV